MKSVWKKYLSVSNRTNHYLFNLFSPLFAFATFPLSNHSHNLHRMADAVAPAAAPEAAPEPQQGGGIWGMIKQAITIYFVVSMVSVS